MRRSLALLASLVLAAVLVACGEDADDAAPRDDLSSSSDASDASGADDGGMTHGEGRHSDASPVAPGARRIEMTARSSVFEPGEIQVAAGENIAIALTSEDLLHDFTIDQLEAHVSAGVGETAEGGFNAAQPGRYSFYCSVEGHREAGMEGTLVVT